MVCILRNLTIVKQPINGFDALPPTNEIHDGADLARIKYRRNKLAHTIETKMATSEFTSIWIELSEVF